MKKPIKTFQSFSKLPKTDKEKNAYLVIGNVQSGKTRFMIEEAENALLNEDYDIAVILTGQNLLLKEQSYSRFINDTKNKSINICEIGSRPVTKISDGSKHIFISLKDKMWLENLLITIESFPDKKIMILDDESDFGSINVGVENDSRFFSLIRKMWNAVKTGSFLSVTATPYADIFSDDSHNFDAIIRLEKNKDYCGIEIFNKNNNYESIGEYNYLKYNKNEMKEILLKVIFEHILRVSKAGLNKSQMIINPSLNKKEHFYLKDIIEEIVLSLWEHWQKLFSYLISKDDEHLKEEMFKILLSLKTNIKILNQHNKRWNKETHSIIIGGALLSRGYTFEKLVTAILWNIPKKTISADVLLQRARWFGYRKKYINFIKVYMPERGIIAFKEAEKLNNILFDSYLNSTDKLIDKINKMQFNLIVPTKKVGNNEDSETEETDLFKKNISNVQKNEYISNSQRNEITKMVKEYILNRIKQYKDELNNNLEWWDIKIIEGIIKNLEKYNNNQKSKFSYEDFSEYCYNTVDKCSPNIAYYLWSIMMNLRQCIETGKNPKKIEIRPLPKQWYWHIKNHGFFSFLKQKYIADKVIYFFDKNYSENYEKMNLEELKKEFKKVELERDECGIDYQKSKELSYEERTDQRIKFEIYNLRLASLNFLISLKKEKK